MRHVLGRPAAFGATIIQVTGDALHHLSGRVTPHLAANGSCR